MKDWLEQLIVNGIVAGAATRAVEKAIEREASLTRKAMEEAIGYGGGPVIELRPIKRKADRTPDELPEPWWVWDAAERIKSGGRIPQAHGRGANEPSPRLDGEGSEP